MTFRLDNNFGDVKDFGGFGFFYFPVNSFKRSCLNMACSISLGGIVYNDPEVMHKGQTYCALHYYLNQNQTKPDKSKYIVSQFSKGLMKKVTENRNKVKKRTF